MAIESLSINIASKTWDPSDDEACLVFKDPSTMAPAIPEVAADIQLLYQAMGHHRLVEVCWKTSSTSYNALGLEVLFIGVVLVSLGGERRRVTASAIRGTTWSNIPGEREMGCGPTGAVLYRVAEWSVLATED